MAHADMYYREYVSLMQFVSKNLLEMYLMRMRELGIPGVV